MTTEKKPRSTATARKTVKAPMPGKPKKAATKPAAGAARTAMAKSVSSAAPAQHSAARLPAAAGETLQGGAAPAADAPTQDSLHRRIAEAAYYRAERRGFAPGGEALDWFEAEAEIRGSRR